MTKIARTLVSRTKSGLNFYLDPQIVAQWPKTARFHVIVKGTAEAGYIVDMVGGEGTMHMCEYPDDRRSQRISFREAKKINGSIPLSEMEQFGVTELEAEILEGATRFVIPPVSQLKAPMKRRRLKKVHNPETYIKSVDEVEGYSAHKQLGWLLGEINLLFASGKVDDVDLELSRPGTGEHGSDFIVGKFAGPLNLTTIKGKIIREETLG